MRIGRVAALCVLFFVASIAVPVGAQAVEETGWAYDLSRDVMSPFCPGRTLAACPSPNAAELIQEIAVKEQAGESREEVEEWLYAQYGDVMRSAPKAEGWGLAAYVFPPLAALAGIGIVVLVLRRLAGGSGSQPDAVSSPVIDSAEHPGDEELERLVDEELSRI